MNEASTGVTPIPEGFEEAIRDLVAAMERLEEGYDRLPPLIRKLAAGVLYKRTGLTLREWRAWAAQLEDAVRGDGQAGPGKTEHLLALLACEDRDQALEGLVGCVQSIPEQAQRFTRDPALLDELTRAAAEQERRIRRARHMLQVLAAPR